MPRPKILGYIVSGADGRSLSIFAGLEKRRVLFLGRHVDVFPSRVAAQRLIRRTVHYADQHGLDWGRPEHYRITPIQAAVLEPAAIGGADG